MDQTPEIPSINKKLVNYDKSPRSTLGLFCGRLKMKAVIYPLNFNLKWKSWESRNTPSFMAGGCKTNENGNTKLGKWDKKDKARMSRALSCWGNVRFYLPVISLRFF